MNWLALLKLAPELVKLIKTLDKRIKKGATVLEIKSTLKKVDRAFEKNDIDSINDIWNK